MSKADVIEIEGKVVEKLPNAFCSFAVRSSISAKPIMQAIIV